jgi:DNA mismatch repair protein MutS
MSTVQEFTTPMMKQFQELKAEYPDCILLFRLGDFYEMFLDDAFVGAKVLGITLTGRPKGKDGRIPMAGVPYHAIDAYLAKLVKAGHKVAICEQLSPPGTKGLIERKIVRIVTPGTLTDEKALEKKENNFLVTVAFLKHDVGLAAVDVSTGEFLVTEFPRAGWQKKIIDELTKLHPAECILSDTEYNDAEVLKVLVLQRGMNVYRYPEWERLAYRAATVVKKHFGVHSLASLQLDDKDAALQAAAVILGYLTETQKDRVPHVTKLSFMRDGEYLQLDTSTILNLEIFSTIRDRNKHGSLIEVLDETCTGMGGRLLRQWFLKPLTSRQAILERQAVVQYFVAQPASAQHLRTAFESLTDIERLAARLSLHQGNPRDVVALKIALQELTKLELPKDSLRLPLLKMFQSLCQSAEGKQLQQFIDRTILDEPAIDIKSGGLIKPGVQKELDELRAVVTHNQSWMSAFEKQERVRSGISSLKVRFNNVFGFYIEISKSNLASVPSDYFRKQTLANGERFVTEELKKHEELILTASEKMNRLEYEIWQDAIEKILSSISYLQALSASIAEIDCLLSFASLAVARKYCCPVITDGDELRIMGGRHPVVEKLLDTGEFVPNDCFLNTTTQQLMMVTGPNMAGKSVLLRQVALIVLLAQMGSFVPASEAQIGLVDRIFVRSGAADAITAGLSTFMVEMVETAHILAQATPKSLIVMDEIGRGTSTYDGISIAWAVAEFLVSKQRTGPKTLFATHYHELQELERLHPGRIFNMQMAVGQENAGPVFLHSLLPGGASHSYGVAVAKLAGIPDSVVTRANEILKDLEKQHIGEKEKSKKPHNESKNSAPKSELANRLHNLNVDAMTPLEALRFLSELKENYS